MKTILIVDDEPDIREIVAFNLSEAGYRCLTAADGVQALDMIRRQHVDLMLLDVMMPGMSGFDVAQSIRNNEVAGVPSDLPIIFLTALGEEVDTLHGFSIGADDYISKPFSVRLLSARVEAVMKRGGGEKDARGETRTDVGYESLRLDNRTYTATIEGQDIGLTKMEYELLYFLLQHPGAVYSRSELLTQVWPENGLVLDRTVDVTITRLRKKIDLYKKHLKTKTGYGYYWEK